mmetsp:Transcript_8028/g.20245  ORF Transcript_8028/g.20245 Transcript_8028/m.20245 type:complete len:254 (+) Transcript_8028:646-1407(+)
MHVWMLSRNSSSYTARATARWRAGAARYPSAAAVAASSAVARGQGGTNRPATGCSACADSHTVRHTRRAAGGSTRCNTVSDQNRSRRLCSGATSVGGCRKGATRTCPPCAVCQPGLRYSRHVTTRASGGPGLSKCSGKLPPPSLTWTLSVCAPGERSSRHRAGRCAFKARASTQLPRKRAESVGEPSLDSGVCKSRSKMWGLVTTVLRVPLAAGSGSSRAIWLGCNARHACSCSTSARRPSARARGRKSSTMA